MQSKEKDSAFNEWLKTKKKQKRQEQDIEKRKQKEIDEGWYTRPRKDCDKAFKRNDHLKNHLLIHSSEKTNICNECDAKFTSKRTLELHTRIEPGRLT